VKQVLITLALCACVCSAQTAPGTPFASGFENNTLLSPVPAGNGPSGVFQSLSGTDTSSGYTWPFNGWNSGAFGVHIDPANGDTSPYASHFFNSIVSMTGHAGSMTQALHLDIENYAKGSCCAQTMLESNSVSSPVHGYYLRAWVMLPSSLGATIQNNSDAWQSIWAQKTSTSYRQENGIVHDSRGGSHPVWHAYDDVLGLSSSKAILMPAPILIPTRALSRMIAARFLTTTAPIPLSRLRSVSGS
jgi:hypothetical protein